MADLLTRDSTNGYVLLTQEPPFIPGMIPTQCDVPNPNYSASHPLINTAIAPAIGAYDVDATIEPTQREMRTRFMAESLEDEAKCWKSKRGSQTRLKFRRGRATI